jgi:gas vesicle protein
MSDRDSGSFFQGLLMGAAIGAILGLLFAPQSGRETRELVRQKVGTAKDKASEVISKIKKPADSDA